MTSRWTELLSGCWIATSEAFTFHSGVIVDRGEACLIDPGLLPSEIDGMRDFILASDATPRSIVLTHSHWDHVLGPGLLPGIETIAHAAFVDEREGSQSKKVARQIAAWETERSAERREPFVLPIPDWTFEERMTLAVGHRTIELLHAPGHAPDHLVVHEPATGLLWAADMLSEAEIPYVCHSLSAYEQTLQALASLEIAVLIPTHGRPTSSTWEIRRRFCADAAYLADLHDRVDRAVRAGHSAEETVSACRGMRFAHPEENARPHRMNVETTYLAFGGEADAAIGWDRMNIDVT